MISANQRRLKVGVLTPHAAAGPEIEIPEMSQGRVTVTVARIRSRRMRPEQSRLPRQPLYGP